MSADPAQTTIEDPDDLMLLRDMPPKGYPLVIALGWHPRELRRAHRLARAGLLERQLQTGLQRNDGRYRYWMFRRTKAGDACFE